MTAVSNPNMYDLLSRARIAVSEVLEHYASISTANRAMQSDFNALVLRIMRTDLQLLSADSDLLELWVDLRQSSFGFDCFTELSRVCREIICEDSIAVSRYFAPLFAVHLPQKEPISASAIPSEDLSRFTEVKEAEALINKNPWLLSIYVIQTSERFREMSRIIHRAMGGVSSETHEESTP